MVSLLNSDDSFESILGFATNSSKWVRTYRMTIRFVLRGKGTSGRRTNKTNLIKTFGIISNIPSLIRTPRKALQSSTLSGSCDPTFT